MIDLRAEIGARLRAVDDEAGVELADEGNTQYSIMLNRTPEAETEAIAQLRTANDDGSYDWTLDGRSKIEVNAEFDKFKARVEGASPGGMAVFYQRSGTDEAQTRKKINRLKP